MPTRPGPPARAYSSKKIICSTSDAPRPPCSAGQPRPIQLSRPSSCSHAQRSSKHSCSSPGPPRPRTAANAPSRRSVSHARASTRKRSCAGVKCRSKRPDGTKAALVCSAAWTADGSAAVVTGAGRGGSGARSRSSSPSAASTSSRRCATRPTAPTIAAEAGAGAKIRVDRLDVNDPTHDEACPTACACW